METKTCIKCKVEKETLNFSKDRKRKDGLNPYCKQCVRDYNQLTKDREDLKNTRKNYQNTKRKTDPIHRLAKDLSRCIRNIFNYKTNKFMKNSRLSRVLGCTFEEFKSHIESQFEPWMNWSNRGLYNGQTNYGWDIDHIIPKGTAKTEEEVLKLNHYTNLRPRCSYINRVKERYMKY
jgi:hypothetical protein